MRKTQTHTGLDGNKLRVGRFNDLASSADTQATSRGVYTSGRIQVELTSGPLEFGQCTASEVAGIQLVESYSIASGTVRLGSRRETVAPDLDTQTLFASWEGERWSLSGPFYGAMADRDLAIQWLVDLAIEETDDGVAAIPQTASLEDVSVMKVIPGLGITETFASDSRPSGGKQVRGGVAFRAAAGPDFESFRIFSPNADTSIVPTNDVSSDGRLLEDHASGFLNERVAARIDDLEFLYV